MQLKERKILLTGATGGIGHELAKQLIASGATVIIAGRGLPRLQALSGQLSKQGGQCLAAELDLGSTALNAQIAAIQHQHPDLDLLINCAGINVFAAADTAREAVIDQLISINLRGTMLLTQAFIPLLKRRPEAAIVNVGSTFGSIGYPGFSVYCATKFGLRGFTEALQRELADSPVHVLYVAPRATRTAMNDDVINRMNAELNVAMDDPSDVAKQIIRAIARNKKRLFIGWPEKLFVRLNGLLTHLVDNALRKQLPVIRRYLKLQEV